MPYRSRVPAVADMIGGHVPMMFGTLGPAAALLSTPIRQNPNEGIRVNVTGTANLR